MKSLSAADFFRNHIVIKRSFRPYSILSLRSDNGIRFLTPPPVSDASPSRLTRLDCLFCRDLRRMEGPPSFVTPTEGPNGGKYNARCGRGLASHKLLWILSFVPERPDSG